MVVSKMEHDYETVFISRGCDISSHVDWTHRSDSQMILFGVSVPIWKSKRILVNSSINNENKTTLAGLK